MIPKLEVRGADREFGLYVDDQLVGTSKLDCDARVQMHFLEKKFQEAHDAGYRNGKERTEHQSNAERTCP